MPSTRTWDIFCTVVDNYGDIGVCWRLARQLAAEHGLGVRLWVDDLASFAKICPDIVPGRDAQHSHGVEVRWWREPFPAVRPADVVVEAFACNPPASYVAAMAARQPKPAWINLEFLSAENWVQGCHALPSPHPFFPLVKHFFFPGFVAGTGGLLAEQNLVQTRDRFQRSAAERARFWEVLGVPAPRAGELQVSLFCYPHDGVDALLRAWAAGGTPVRCLVPEGTVTAALTTFFGVEHLAPGAILRKAGLEVGIFPFLDQDSYDRLLWTCDLNLVRGEDSFVRAQWAARPLLWQIYPQKEGAHWPKLEAFLEMYCQGLPAETTAALAQLWRAWNHGDAAAIAPAWTGFWEHRLELQAHAERWAGRLAQSENLANNLARFCENVLK
ncbi:MAG: elongation factor P maturation arginine rhamnosyltransferase EarP [Betaproteobacteria bacterium]|nr:MAG: elongation factor P maturation arginine rhamnosyltransferase EarP [Betaproteobacteria bacterium]